MPTRNSDLRSSGDTWMLGLGLAETICIIYHGRRNCRRPRARSRLLQTWGGSTAYGRTLLARHKTRIPIRARLAWRLGTWGWSAWFCAWSAPLPTAFRSSRLTLLPLFRSGCAASPLPHSNSIMTGRGLHGDPLVNRVPVWWTKRPVSFPR